MVQSRAIGMVSGQKSAIYGAKKPFFRVLKIDRLVMGLVSMVI